MELLCTQKAVENELGPDGLDQIAEERLPGLITEAIRFCSAQVWAAYGVQSSIQVPPAERPLLEGLCLRLVVAEVWRKGAKGAAPPPNVAAGEQRADNFLEMIRKRERNPVTSPEAESSAPMEEAQMDPNRVSLKSMRDAGYC